MNDGLVEFVMYAVTLKNVKRTGWVKSGVPELETVASHAFGVTALAMIFGDFLGLDTEKMMKMAVLHDLAESRTGDIPPVAMDRTRKRAREDVVMTSLFDFSGGERYRVL
jgi:putative hydrolase of HD superfamily